MFYEIFNRLLLVTCIITLSSILFKDYWFKKSEYKNEVLGLASGIVGVLLLFYPTLSVNTSMYIVILWAIFSPIVAFGSCFSSIIAGLTIFSFRFVTSQFLFEEASITLLFTIFCGVCSILPVSKIKKWLGMNFLYCIVLSIYSTSLLIPFYLFAAICTLISFYILFIFCLIRRNNYSYFYLKVQSTKDFLTGINNSRQFNLLLNKTFADIINQNQPLAMLMLDIDHFKYINDTYGHPAGDKILKQFTSILKNISPPQNISRVGGEEFCILLPNYSLSQAYDLAEEIRLTIQKNSFEIEPDQTINITLSIGISIYPSAAKSKEDLIKSADQALYKAKRLGRNRISLPVKIYNTKEPAS